MSGSTNTAISMNILARGIKYEPTAAMTTEMAAAKSTAKVPAPTPRIIASPGPTSLQAIIDKGRLLTVSTWRSGARQKKKKRCVWQNEKEKEKIFSFNDKALSVQHKYKGVQMGKHMGTRKGSSPSETKEGKDTPLLPPNSTTLHLLA